VQPDGFGAVHRQQAIGINGAQIVAGGEGQPPDLRERADVRGLKVQLGQPLAVKGHALPHAVKGFLQEFDLQVFQRWPGQCF